MYFVYVLQSAADKKLYVGYALNLEQRIQAHNQGNVASTKNRKPLKLIFYESYTNKGDVLRREKYLKTTAGKRALKFMLKNTLCS
ncbi:excinuclease ABC subunit C [Candidatus Peregrinibacteria bacterium CG1_02_54_53]|nr:MAG: excinuclease ABC subunit C [Candidatus Peregrinibacteria bacterium CG1_02_54_53]